MILEAIGDSMIETENLVGVTYYGNEKEYRINIKDDKQVLTPEVFRFNINLKLFDLNPETIINELYIMFYNYNSGIVYSMVIQIPSKNIPDSYNTLRISSKSYNILKLLMQCIKNNTDFNSDIVKEKIPEELL